MNHRAFFEALNKRGAGRLYLFHGEEAYVKQKALENLRKRLLPEGLEALNEAVLENPTAEALIAAAETLPMLAERRLVVVRDCALLYTGKVRDESEESARLVAYLPHVPDTACIVFFCRQPIDGRKKTSQALQKAAEVVQFAQLDDHELTRWMQSTLGRNHKSISASNAAHLAFTCGRALYTLVAELDKLAAYAQDAQEITAQMIDAIATRTLECTVFEMTDALAEGREADAFRLLAAMCASGESRIGILAMIHRQFRQLLHTSIMQRAGMQQGEIQARLGVPPFAMRKLARQAARFDVETLRAHVNECAQTDFAIKSGRMREEIALDRLLLHVRPA